MQSLQYFSDMPTAPSTGYKVIVTTRNAGGTAIDGPTASNGFSMKQIGSGQIADGIITSIKPAERFMKRVPVFDTPGGNAAGWNPDGSTVTFAIQIQIPKVLITLSSMPKPKYRQVQQTFSVKQYDNHLEVSD